uniref:Putative oxidoreductase family protein n=1 Tax=viral metagenome TaxID=1070528 RepID=A0A6M3LJL2_9ZZZZ
MTGKAVVIGLGKIGFSFGLDTLRKQPASHLACYSEILPQNMIGVCDVDEQKLRQIEYDYMPQIGYACQDVEELLGEFEPEIVSIATPTPTHVNIVKDVAKFECVKAIFLEKPIAQNIRDAKEMIQVCKDADIRLSVNYTRRWNPVYQRYVGESFDMAIGLHPGPIVRTGSHMLDLFNLYFGKPLHVRAFGGPEENYLEEEYNDYNINGYVQYAGGSATLISGMHRPNTVLFELDLFSKSRRVRFVDNGDKTFHYRLAPGGYSDLNEYQVEMMIRSGHEQIMEHTVNYTTPLMMAIEQTINCIRFPLMNFCSGEAALEALKVALGIHYSAMHGNKRLQLDKLPDAYGVRTY